MSALEQSWGYQVGDQDVTFAVKPGSLHLHQTWAQMTAVAAELGVRFVVLDTFSSLAPEADETKDAPRITRWLSDLSVAIDGTAMLIHHPGWGDGERARGGYQLEANVDEVLLLRGNGNDPTVSLERKKVKDGPAGARVWLRRRPIYESVIVEEISVSEAVDGPMADRILTVLADLEQATGPQLCKELDAGDHRRPVQRALRRLAAEGRIIAEGPRGRQRYRLSKEGDG